MSVYIGGLILEKMPCECKAPFAETYIDVDGKVKVTLWQVNSPNAGGSQVLFSERHEDNDALEMVCTRCGWRL